MLRKLTAHAFIILLVSFRKIVFVFNFPSSLFWRHLFFIFLYTRHTDTNNYYCTVYVINTCCDTYFYIVMVLLYCLYVCNFSRHPSWSKNIFEVLIFFIIGNTYSCVESWGHRVRSINLFIIVLQYTDWEYCAGILT